jgi:hypothetical protein
MAKRLTRDKRISGGDLQMIMDQSNWKLPLKGKEERELEAFIISIFK